ncbi:NfeD family protein [Cellvibrio japonicus]|uniref:Putative membrane protein n=1 Tax=Cellvibrio japonicus (strain Ueda107) TaxID=498211 RepID=B3PBA5_CELJU|nr:NfeD family protein [Cellvibrio japonicus]ACE83795.1 putative membrane protein [Cellvibrio japonicus Ueda107]QEI11690.1 NfeD family protein [Cellvibrio japonicus]QEI15264.1 NfeD family protein [Cellvibrio japonicus]QEI18844.1 NfeD family protein [Cellvibrio japonicus]
MIDFFLNLQAWHWLTLGIFVLILELLGAGGFLLGIGIASLVVASVLALVPGLGWHWQFVIFAVLSVVVTLVYWKRFRRFNEKTEQPLLNSRVQRLIGRKVPLLTPITNGRGKVQIEDALWTVSATRELAQGTAVVVTGAEGMTLLVEAVETVADESST